jgi:hypothetical protein
VVVCRESCVKDKVSSVTVGGQKSNGLLTSYEEALVRDSLAIISNFVRLGLIFYSKIVLPPSRCGEF